jgi:hypothetical protein
MSLAVYREKRGKTFGNANATCVPASQLMDFYFLFPKNGLMVFVEVPEEGTAGNVFKWELRKWNLCDGKCTKSPVARHSLVGGGSQHVSR